MQYLQEYTQLSVNAFANQVFSPERFGTGWLLGLDGKLADQVARFKSLNVPGDLIGRYIEGYKKRVSAAFGAESRCASSVITGPANFPVRQQEKRRASARNRWEELTHYENRMTALLEKIARREYKAEHGITPLIEAQRNLNRRMKEQDLMKRTNMAIRKAKGRDEQEMALLDMGYEPRQIVRLLEPERCRRVGFQAWELSNNNAQIVRLKARVEELKQKEVKAERQTDTEPVEFEGGSVVQDYGDDRIRIYYDSKPDGETIAKLKRNGFKWSPNNQAWQRQITGNARYAVYVMTGLKLEA